MLKKYSYIFSLLLILSLSVEAKSLLYKVSTKNSTVYILGSIHLAKPELYPLDRAITNAYNNSEVLVVEVDPSSQESLSSMQNTMISSGMYSRGKNLQSELSTKTYMALRNYTSKAGIPLEVMEQMKPWVVMLQLTVTEMMRLGYSPELGIDKHFLDKARLDNKPVVELETAEEQMALLSKDDKTFQDKLLLYTLESMHELEPMLDEMFRGWQRGDADTFDKIMNIPLETDPSLKEVYEDLITKRNYKMTDKIEGFLKTKKDHFVVVGSGHVIGKEGIIDLLEKRGFRVIQK
ncbi:TraB/GumN family protein [Campylobacterota bacterium]